MAVYIFFPASSCPHKHNCFGHFAKPLARVSGIILIYRLARLDCTCKPLNFALIYTHARARERIEFHCCMTINYISCVNYKISWELARWKMVSVRDNDLITALSIYPWCNFFPHYADVLCQELFGLCIYLFYVGRILKTLRLPDERISLVSTRGFATGVREAALECSKLCMITLPL